MKEVRHVFFINFLAACVTAKGKEGIYGRALCICFGV